MSKKINYGIGILILFLVAIYFALGNIEYKNEVNIQPISQKNNESPQNFEYQKQHGAEVIAHAYKNKLANIQVRSAGRVVATLPDDNQGNRHQKFILELPNGQTVLVAHNIDLAPKIDYLKKGDEVEFYGEYEYSNKGGVIHWTHHDPSGRHIDGWLKYKGKQYK